LGAILYEMLTGQPPFRGPTVIDTVMKLLTDEPPDPRALKPKADRDLAAIALKCLQKEPAKRYGSAEAMADDLARWQAREPTKARPPSLAGLAWRWLRRNAAAAVGVIVLGFFTGITIPL
jgi:serine/threonine-protein kinase